MSFRLGRFGIKAKQVIGVTLIVTLAIAALTTVYVGLMVRVWLTETRARGELVAKAAYQRAFAVAAEDTTGELAGVDDAGAIFETFLEGHLPVGGVLGGETSAAPGAARPKPAEAAGKDEPLF